MTVGGQADRRAPRSPSHVAAADPGEIGPISIIVPVCNEERVLEGCLELLLEHAEPGELEVVVVCNGCTDRTADVARSFGPRVRVVETPVAGKPQALNLGDERASGFPRFYVDADVRLATRDLRRVAAVLCESDVLAAAPTLNVDLSSSSRLVRSYYRFWMELPWVRDELVGSGVFAVSREGHQRLGRFPEEGADDYLASNAFARGERRSVPDARFTVPGSPTMKQLLRRRARILSANRLVSLHLGGRPDTRSSVRAVLSVVARKPRLVPDAIVFLVVAVLSRRHARRRLRSGDTAWNADQRLPNASKSS